MLKSYQYTDEQYTGIRLQNKRFTLEERAIAKDFISKHPSAAPESTKCPACDGEHLVPMFSKWGIQYFQCAACGSIASFCSEKTISAYKSNKPMVELRTSSEYQKDAYELREGVWHDFIEWLEVRSYRFLKKTHELDILDWGNRYEGFAKMIQDTRLCGRYELRESLLIDKFDQLSSLADILLYENQLQQSINPLKDLASLRSMLKQDGLLILNTRAGSGFDILTLKGENEKIYPYEHIFLPSTKGLILLLEKAGYRVLEITTPGVMDVNHVLSNMDKINESESFVKHLIHNSSEQTLQEFQRFLQKNGFSSFVQVIATVDRKGTNHE